MIDAVLVEWEDVLVETRQARREALHGALADEGLAPPTDDALDAVEGVAPAAASATLLRAAGIDDPTLAELVSLRAARRFREWLARGVTLVPGAREIVERFASQAPVVIVTRATREDTDTVLRVAGLEASVRAIVSAEQTTVGDDSAASPYDRALAHLARLRPVLPDRVVALVNNESGARAARAAGVRVIAAHSA